MDADERAICTYLKSFPRQFISGKEISRRADGKWRFTREPEWAAPVLERLVEQGILESDSTGHFRLVMRVEKQKPKKWISPQMKQILQESGKDFGEILKPEDQDDFYER